MASPNPACVSSMPVPVRASSASPLGTLSRDSRLPRRTLARRPSEPPEERCCKRRQTAFRAGNLYGPYNEELFDLIVVHPPAVPYAPSEDWGLSAGMRLATDGGDDGSRLVLQSIRDAPARLREGGALLLLLPHWSNFRKAHEGLRREFADSKCLAGRRVPFFPAIEGNPSAGMMGRVTQLARDGIIEIDFSTDVFASRVSVVKAVKR